MGFKENVSLEPVDGRPRTFNLTGKCRSRPDKDGKFDRLYNGNFNESVSLLPVLRMAKTV